MTDEVSYSNPTSFGGFSVGEYVTRGKGVTVYIISTIAVRDEDQFPYFFLRSKRSSQVESRVENLRKAE